MKSNSVRALVIGAVAAVAAVSPSCAPREAPPPPSSPALSQATSPTTRPAVTPPTTRTSTAAFAPIGKETLLPNAHVVTSKIISGAQPEGDQAFKALRDMGVKTIVSVDGAKPDVEAARKYGLRYVHLPITYSGVKPDEGKAIAKALEELPGPIYVHCHHGQHRSAAAVAVACVYNGWLPPERAESVLETFGTGANYKGLWQAARDARPLDPEEIRDFKIDFVETTKLPPLADAMVGVDERWDHMKAIQKAGWRTPPSQPDLDPPHEALQLEEVFTELGRTDRSHADHPDFVKRLAEAATGARMLRETLAARPVNTARADAAFKRVAASCAACHASYRD
jgi:protein tyrosine phosphatase (PTP) superfamily phosphohydrolase (DUF442 family)